ncbi:protein of unknown function DUF123 [Methanosalsum zhilinae DSM 4017]|uniref:GIY-YIG domain-containing protein n=1 Tax=Methanosalsum zhilinae (strain DSM 4017 / NBRC 107636 / OCM 62 / WeN5) TaxID=679901 RepID=F7XLN6_METZD|nr:GIY-YIG nuclease family protein [Methanosalsum zhilinae]AEH60859.1 protein of unknown function DUF123 [Methanosalsum zhilinae DSM 4017]
MREKGSYFLIFQNKECTIDVGSLGSIKFSKGYHVYVGSALGNGGLKRVIRHINLHEKKDRSSKWHIDYLLLNPHFNLIFAVCIFTNKRIECLLAENMDQKSIKGFGCTDCICDSHLFFSAENPCFDIKNLLHHLDLTKYQFNEVGFSPE